jgi:hypothetical protein
VKAEMNPLNNTYKLSITIVLASLIATDTAFAGLFTITNRRYGSVPAQYTVEIDTVLNTLETQVNADMPDTDSSNYLSGLANATSIAGAGINTDYATPFSIFAISNTTGFGADLGSSTLGQVTRGDVKANEISGFSAQSAMTFGLNLGQFGGKVSWIDLNRAKVFASFASSKFDQDEVSSKYSMWGLNALYQVMPAKGYSFMQWDGVNVGLGLRSSKINLIVNQAVNIATPTETVNMPAPTTLDSNFNGSLSFGADINSLTIPIEVSTSARLLYFYGVFGGLGFDLNSSTAKSIANITGDVAFTTSPDLGDVGGTATLDLGDEGHGLASNARYFAGMNFTLGIVGLSVQLNQSLQNRGGTGMNFSLKAYY